jgi:hypothetical protein
MTDTMPESPETKAFLETLNQYPEEEEDAESAKEETANDVGSGSGLEGGDEGEEVGEGSGSEGGDEGEEVGGGSAMAADVETDHPKTAKEKVVSGEI